MPTPHKKRKRSRKLKQAASVAAIAAIALGFAVWSASTSNEENHALTILGIQPRGGQVLAVDLSAEAELHAAAPGDVLLFSIADPGAPVALESTTCSAVDSLYSCQHASAGALQSGQALIGRLAASAAAATADPFAPVRYAVDYAAAHSQLNDVTLWLNLASPDMPAGTTASNLAAKVNSAVESGQWPASCRGFLFHLVVPSTGNTQMDELGKLWWQALISRCHGTLASYTPDWLGYGIHSWNLPKLGHGVSQRATPAGVTFTVPAAVLFALDSSTLSRSAQESLSEVASELDTRFAGLPVEVLGYTDASGTSQYNDALSAARASAVAAWLSGPGHVPASLVTAEGLGSIDLLASPAASRRVEIVAGSTTVTPTS